MFKLLHKMRRYLEGLVDKNQNQEGYNKFRFFSCLSDFLEELILFLYYNKVEKRIIRQTCQEREVYILSELLEVVAPFRNSGDKYQSSEDIKKSLFNKSFSHRFACVDAYGRICIMFEGNNQFIPTTIHVD